MGHASRGFAGGQPLVSDSAECSAASCSRVGSVVSGCTPLGRPAPEFPAVGRDCSLSPSLTSIGGRGATRPARCPFMIARDDRLLSRLQTRHHLRSAAIFAARLRACVTPPPLPPSACAAPFFPISPI